MTRRNDTLSGCHSACHKTVTYNVMKIEMNRIQIIILSIIFLSIGCKKRQYSTENISHLQYDIICSPELMPKYDGNKVTIGKNF